MQHLFNSSVILVFALALLPILTGCPRPANDSSGSGQRGANGPDEDHGHSHGHAEGPSGGHLIELGQEEYHVEWLHDDEEGRLTFIILDAAAKEQVPIEAEALTVKLTTKGEDGQEVTKDVAIPGVDRTEDGKTARFELVDKTTIVNIVDGGKDVQVVLEVPIGEETYSERIEHEKHGHSHSH